MALKIKPPQHGADAPGVFVSENDDAWDTDRINGDPAAKKAVEDYWFGRTRFDPSVGNVFQYLDEGKRPFRVHLRRLSSREVRRIQGVMDTVGRMSAWNEFCRVGVQSVENGPEGFASRDALTPDELDYLFRAGNLDHEIGMAVFNYSAPLTDAEKKPSGS